MGGVLQRHSIGMFPRNSSEQCKLQVELCASKINWPSLPRVQQLKCWTIKSIVSCFHFWRQKKKKTRELTVATAFAKPHSVQVKRKWWYRSARAYVKEKSSKSCFYIRDRHTKNWIQPCSQHKERQQNFQNVPLNASVSFLAKKKVGYISRKDKIWNSHDTASYWRAHANCLCRFTYTPKSTQNNYPVKPSTHICKAGTS